jgi:hypothetical protein
VALIDHTYFIGELNIPNTDRADVQERLALMIKKYEGEFFLDLFGYEMYKNFAANLSSPSGVWADLLNGVEYTYNSKPAKWRGLKNSTDKLCILANYVYYHFMRDSETQTAGMGEVKTKPENAVSISPAGKMARAWNEMSTWIGEMIQFLNTNRDSYSGWSNQSSYSIERKFRPINIFGV